MNIYERINKSYLRLSKGQRKVAQFILEQPNTIAANIASEVGRLAGVSESTVIRFCYAMELSGYLELQTKIKEYVTLQQTITSPKIEKSTSVDEIKGKMLDHVKQISNILQKVDSKQLLNVSNIIKSSRNLFIAGFKGNEEIAKFSHNRMLANKFNVKRIEQEDILNKKIIHSLDEDSAIIIFLEEEKNYDVDDLIQYALENKAQVIIIRDFKKYPYTKYNVTNLYLGVEGALKTIAAYSFITCFVESLGNHKNMVS